MSIADRKGLVLLVRSDTNEEFFASVEDGGVRVTDVSRALDELEMSMRSRKKTSVLE